MMIDVAFDPFGTLDHSRASKESVSAILLLAPTEVVCSHLFAFLTLIWHAIHRNSLRSCSSPSADQLPYGVCLAAANRLTADG